MERPMQDDPETPEATDVMEGGAPDALEQLRRERDENREKYLRALADFQNYQRRSAENENRARQGGIAGIVRAVVPILDQFDLALAAPGDGDSLRTGMKMVRQGLIKALATSGIELIEPAVGTPFDPNLHEAVMRQPAPGVAPDAVSSLLQAGYRLGEMVLRPAKVAIAPPAE